MRLLPTLIAGVLLMSETAVAQTPPRNVRGEVIELNAERISVRLLEGGTLNMRLASDWSVQVMRPISPEALTPGSFVGTIETPQPGDWGLAHEAHQFLPGVRMGEGRMPWDRPLGATMTQGDIGLVTRTARGHEFDLSFPGGSRRIVLPEGAPSVRINNEGRQNIKAGVHVFVLAWPEPDGSLRVDAVATGEDGRLPPL